MAQADTTKDIYSLEKLRKSWTDGKRFNFVYFYDFEDKDTLIDPPNQTCLTQWYPSEFVDESGRKYCCSEQYMMAQKAILFNDQESLAKILQTKNPEEMKALGRGVKNFNIDKWVENSQEIVFQGNLLKFKQNERLRNYILSFSKNSVLVEASPDDNIWGIGLAEDDQDAKDPLKWKGSNYLGFQLTRVRDNLL